MPATIDTHGTLSPDYNENSPRFQILVRGYDPREEKGWEYQLDVYDRKYLDSDALTIYAVAGGSTWAEAFQQAGKYIDQALNTDRCIF